MNIVFSNKIPGGKLKGVFITEYGEIIRKNGKGLIKPRQRTDGLLKITYGRQTDFVHLSVALTFVPNPNNYKYVLHIDGNVQNNHKDNLKWSESPDRDSEKYKTIPGFPKYKISEDGTIKSYFDRHCRKIRLSYVDENGYSAISLRGENKKETKFIHRLVADAYLPNPKKLPEVDHIDRNRSNNHVSNLRWASLKTQALNRTPRTTIKKICQFEITGKYIRTHSSITEAARYLNKTPEQGQAIRKCANKNKKGCAIIFLVDSFGGLNQKMHGNTI